MELNRIRLSTLLYSFLSKLVFLCCCYRTPTKRLLLFTNRFDVALCKDLHWGDASLSKHTNGWSSRDELKLNVALQGCFINARERSSPKQSKSWQNLLSFSLSHRIPTTTMADKQRPDCDQAHVFRTATSSGMLLHRQICADDDDAADWLWVLSPLSVPVITDGKSTLSPLYSKVFGVEHAPRRVLWSVPFQRKTLPLCCHVSRCIPGMLLEVIVDLRMQAGWTVGWYILYWAIFF